MRIKNEARQDRGGYKKAEKEVNFLERKFKGEMELKTKRNLKVLNEKYIMKRKVLKTVIEKLKQRMFAKSAKLRRYEQRIEKFR